MANPLDIFEHADNYMAEKLKATPELNAGWLEVGDNIGTFMRFYKSGDQKEFQRYIVLVNVEARHYTINKPIHNERINEPVRMKPPGAASHGRSRKVY